MGWFVGHLGLNGPLRQYFSLYRAVSQRGRKKIEKIDERKISKQPPPAPIARAIGPCPTMVRISTGTAVYAAPSHHPTSPTIYRCCSPLGHVIKINLYSGWLKINMAKSLLLKCSHSHLAPLIALHRQRHRK